MARGIVSEGKEPEEAIVPIIFNNRPYTEMIDQEIQCELIEDPQLLSSDLQNTIAAMESELSSMRVSHHRARHARCTVTAAD